jgi:hypothetical protein
MSESSKSSYKKWLSGVGVSALEQELSNLQSSLERNVDDSVFCTSVKEKIQVALQELHKRNGYSGVS